MTYSKKRKEYKKERQNNREKALDREASEAIFRLCQKRIQTVFVGAVSKIEDEFGSLWGNDEVEEEDMTDQQLVWYKKFLDIRDKIFDQGNEQKNMLIRDIKMYNIKYEGNSYRFEVNNEQ